MSFYSATYGIFRDLMLNIVFPTEIVGAVDEIPDGPVVLCANHQSGADVILLVGCTPRQISFMAKKELFKIPILGGFMRAMGAFPVDRSGGDVAAIKKGLSALKKGEMLGVFPQGTRFPGVHPATTANALHDGAAMMALRADAAILPVAIESPKYRIRPFKKVRIHYGKALSAEECSDIYQKNKSYAEVTAEVFGRIVSMLPNE